MELKSQQIVNAGVLVLGGGAGLSAAIKAGKHCVGVLQVFETVSKLRRIVRGAAWCSTLSAIKHRLATISTAGNRMFS